MITTVPSADREKATVRVRIAFDEPGDPILPDMGVKVALYDAEDAAGEARPSHPVVPRAALRGPAGDETVFVLDGDRVARRRVRLGDARDGAGVEMWPECRQASRW